ncbi:MAG: hypothetical protein AAF497_10780, partial [Planctomycetota bacterium]
AKVKIQHHNGTREMFFNQRQIMMAMKVSQEATRRADLQKSKKSYDEKNNEPETKSSTVDSVTAAK